MLMIRAGPFSIKLFLKLKYLTKDFSKICDWFIYNKLSICISEDETKSVLFTIDHGLNLTENLDKKYVHLHLFHITIFRSSRPEVFCKKGVLKNFKKFTGKNLRQSFFFHNY